MPENVVLDDGPWAFPSEEVIVGAHGFLSRAGSYTAVLLTVYETTVHSARMWEDWMGLHVVARPTVLVALRLASSSSA